MSVPGSPVGDAGSGWRALRPATSSVVSASAELTRLLDHVARRAGSLSFSQYGLLGALRETHPSPREPWELGRALGAGSAQVSALLDGLERAGLLLREPHDRDRRRRLVRLTGEGVARVEAVGARIRAVEEVVLSRAAGRGGTAELHRSAERLRAVLAELVAGDPSFLLLSDPGRTPDPG